MGEVIDIIPRHKQAITLQEFRRRLLAAEYVPSGFLETGQKITLESVLNGLSLLQSSQPEQVERPVLDRERLQQELKHLNSRETKYNSLSREQQDKDEHVLLISKIWARQADIRELLKCRKEQE
jgi:hypothetical protein